MKSIVEQRVNICCLPFTRRRDPYMRRIWGAGAGYMGYMRVRISKDVAGVQVRGKLSYRFGFGDVKRVGRLGFSCCDHWRWRLSKLTAQVIGRPPTSVSSAPWLSVNKTKQVIVINPWTTDSAAVPVYATLQRLLRHYQLKHIYCTTLCIICRRCYCCWSKLQ